VLLAKLVPNYTSTQVYPSHTHNLVLSSAVEIDAHPDAYIVHYKGKRKHWMRDHVEAIKQMKVAA
jgi:L-ascorbate metabolism protein UlaG (beta-lactamase superfamily)